MTQDMPLEVIDTEQLTSLAAAAGVEAAAGILDAFWRSNEDLVRLLAESLKAHNFDDAAKAAHALKGSAINLGAIQLAERAKCIEIAARDGDRATIAGAFQQLAGDISDARAAFQTLMGSIAA